MGEVLGFLSHGVACGPRPATNVSAAPAPVPAILTAPPIGSMNVGSPLPADAPVGLIPSPRKSRVAGLPPNSDDWPIMSSGRHTGAPVESYGRLRPSPADSIGAGSCSSRGGHCCSDVSGSDTCMASWWCRCPDDEAPCEGEDASRPSTRRNEEVDDVAPICAAFWSNAVADMCGDGEGGGGGANCCRSAATGAEKIEDDASVARHSDGGLPGIARSGRPTPPPRSGNCGAGAIDDGANMPPIRPCDVPATLLLLALTFAAVTELCESTGTAAAGEGSGGAS